MKLFKIITDIEALDKLDDQLFDLTHEYAKLMGVELNIPEHSMYMAELKESIIEVMKDNHIEDVEEWLKIWML